MTQAILLGAGRGSRLDTERGTGPKWMIEVEGQSLAQHLVNSLHAHDVTDVLLVRGALGGKVLSPSVAYAEVVDSRNMLQTLHRVRNMVRDDVIIAYCDLLLEPDVLRTLLDHDGDAGVVVDRSWRALFSMRADEPLSIAESCRIVDGRLAEVGQPLAGRSPEAQYVGVMRFRYAVFHDLMRLYDQLSETASGGRWRNAASFEAAYFTDFLQEAIDRGFPLDAICIDGGWLEFDTPRDLAIARRLGSNPMPAIFDLLRLPDRPSVLSSGGVAVRGAGSDREVLLVGTGQPGDWRIPKGMLNAGELVEEAARREVQEETGVPVSIERKAGVYEWTYEYDNRSWRERCYFYRMSCQCDVTPAPDSEHAVAAWIPVSAALCGMRFSEEREALQEVLS